MVSSSLHESYDNDTASNLSKGVDYGRTTFGNRQRRFLMRAEIVTRWPASNLPARTKARTRPLSRPLWWPESVFRSHVLLSRHPLAKQPYARHGDLPHRDMGCAIPAATHVWSAPLDAQPRVPQNMRVFGLELSLPPGSRQFWRTNTTMGAKIDVLPVRCMKCRARLHDLGHADWTISSGT